MQPALQHPEVVITFLAAEVKTGRIFGPVGPEIAPAVHVNRFGLVPKGHNNWSVEAYCRPVARKGSQCE